MYIPTTETANIISLMSKDHLNFISIAEGSNVDLQNLVNTANDHGFKIAGGIFPALIYNDKRCDTGVVLQHLSDSSKVSISAGLQKPDSKIELPNWTRDYHCAIVLVDGLTSGISMFLEKVYEVYGNKLTYAGAGCGSLTLESRPCLFNNEGAFKDAALLLMLPNNMTIGVQHGWKRAAGPFLANKTDGNLIEEINWKPAFDVYEEAIKPYSDEAIEKDNFFDVAKRFPFGILREGYEDVVRDPVLTPDGKSLMCVGEVSNNTSINILKGEPENLIQCAEKAAEMSLKSIIPSKVFVIDCISRSLFLEDQFVKELEVVNNVLSRKNDSLTLEGVLSLGEISSYGDGYIEFFNKSIVVSAIT